LAIDCVGERAPSLGKRLRRQLPGRPFPLAQDSATILQTATRESPLLVVRDAPDGGDGEVDRYAEQRRRLSGRDHARLSDRPPDRLRRQPDGSKPVAVEIDAALPRRCVQEPETPQHEAVAAGHRERVAARSRFSLGRPSFEEARFEQEVALRTHDVPAPVPALPVKQFLPLSSAGAGDRAHSHAPPQASKALNPAAAAACRPTNRSANARPCSRAIVRQVTRHGSSTPAR